MRPQLRFWLGLWSAQVSTAVERSNSMFTRSTVLPHDIPPGPLARVIQQRTSRTVATIFFFFLSLNTWMYFSYVTTNPELDSYGYWCPFTCSMMPQTFSFWLYYLQCVFFIPRLVALWLQNGCCTSRHHIHTEGRKNEKPVTFPFHQNGKIFPENPHSILANMAKNSD